MRPFKMVITMLPCHGYDADRILDLLFPWVSTAAHCGYPINFLSRVDFEFLENGLPRIPLSPRSITCVLQLLMEHGFLRIYGLGVSGDSAAVTTSDIEWELWHPQSRPLRQPDKLVMTLTRLGLSEVARRFHRSGYRWCSDIHLHDWVRSDLVPEIMSIWCMDWSPGPQDNSQPVSIDESDSNAVAILGGRLKVAEAQVLLEWLLSSRGRWFPLSECMSAAVGLNKVGVVERYEIGKYLHSLAEAQLMKFYRTAPVDMYDLYYSYEQYYRPTVAEIFAELSNNLPLNDRGFDVLMGAIVKASVHGG